MEAIRRDGGGSIGIKTIKSLLDLGLPVQIPRLSKCFRIVIFPRACHFLNSWAIQNTPKKMRDIGSAHG